MSKHILFISDDAPPLKLVIVQDARTGTPSSINQNEFFMLSGSIQTKSEDVLGKKMNSSAFKLEHHQGVITGNLWIKKFIEENPKYTVMTMDW